jgi:hypothetical protein
VRLSALLFEGGTRVPVVRFLAGPALRSRRAVDTRKWVARVTVPAQLGDVAAPVGEA